MSVSLSFASCALTFTPVQQRSFPFRSLICSAKTGGTYCSSRGCYIITNYSAYGPEGVFPFYKFPEQTGSWIWEIQLAFISQSRAVMLMKNGEVLNNEVSLDSEHKHQEVQYPHDTCFESDGADTVLEPLVLMSSRRSRLC